MRDKSIHVLFWAIDHAQKIAANPILPSLLIRDTLAAGPGNTNARVLAAFANLRMANHMQPDALRARIKCAKSLRARWVLSGDSVVAFAKGLFGADPQNPAAASFGVITTAIAACRPISAMRALRKRIGADQRHRRIFGRLCET